jgi:hypothetical protein
MSATQQTTTRVGKPKRTIKPPENFADQDFVGSYKRPKNAENTQAGKDLLAAAENTQVPKVEKSPTFVGFA